MSSNISRLIFYKIFYPIVAGRKGVPILKGTKEGRNKEGVAAGSFK